MTDDEYAIHERRLTYSRTIAIVLICLYLLQAFYSSDGWPELYRYFESILFGLFGAGFTYFGGLVLESLGKWGKEYRRE